MIHLLIYQITMWRTLRSKTSYYTVGMIFMLVYACNADLVA
jgi:hypothetical protein